MQRPCRHRRPSRMLTKGAAQPQRGRIRQLLLQVRRCGSEVELHPDALAVAGTPRATAHSPLAVLGPSGSFAMRITSAVFASALVLSALSACNRDSSSTPPAG